MEPVKGNQDLRQCVHSPKPHPPDIVELLPNSLHTKVGKFIAPKGDSYGCIKSDCNPVEKCDQPPFAPGFTIYRENIVLICILGGQILGLLIY